MPIYSEWVGTTLGFVDAQIHPRVQGYLLKQVYQDGHAVKAGELLFQIDDRDYKAALDQAKGDLAQQQANYLKNKQDLDRDKTLVAQGVISPEEFDHIQQATRASSAQVESAKAAVETAQLNLEWTQVKSPIDGIAGFATVQVGDLVTPATLLTTVSQVNPIKVNFPISEQEYLQASDRDQGASGHWPREGRAGSPADSRRRDRPTNIPVTSTAWTVRSMSRPGLSKCRDFSQIPTQFCAPASTPRSAPPTNLSVTP